MTSLQDYIRNIVTRSENGLDLAMFWILDLGYDTLHAVVSVFTSGSI